MTTNEIAYLFYKNMKSKKVHSIELSYRQFNWLKKTFEAEHYVLNTKDNQGRLDLTAFDGRLTDEKGKDVGYWNFKYDEYNTLMFNAFLFEDKLGTDKGLNVPLDKELPNHCGYGYKTGTKIFSIMVKDIMNNNCCQTGEFIIRYVTSGSQYWKAERINWETADWEVEKMTSKHSHWVIRDGGTPERVVGWRPVLKKSDYKNLPSTEDYDIF